MGKIRPGNAANSKLNGEWARHVRPFFKRITSGIRRLDGKASIREAMREDNRHGRALLK